VRVIERSWLVPNVHSRCVQLTRGLAATRASEGLRRARERGSLSAAAPGPRSSRARPHERTPPSPCSGLRVSRKAEQRVRESIPAETRLSPTSAWHSNNAHRWRSPNRASRPTRMRDQSPRRAGSATARFHRKSAGSRGICAPRLAAALRRDRWRLPSSCGRRRGTRRTPVRRCWVTRSSKTNAFRIGAALRSRTTSCMCGSGSTIPTGSMQRQTAGQLRGSALTRRTAASDEALSRRGCARHRLTR